MKTITPTAIFITLTASIAGILIGYTTAIIAGTLPFITEQFHLNAWSGGLLVSSILIGAFIGAIISGPIVNRLGQKPSLILAAIIFTIASLLCAFTPNESFLIAFRFLLGLAVGVATMVAPLYISETSPKEWRGAMVSAVQLMITLGIFLSYLMAFIFDNGLEWRLLFGIAAIPSALLFIFMLFQPESPRWLLLKGQTEKAKAVFQKVNHHAWEQSDIDVIQKDAHLPKAVFKDLLKPLLLPVVLLSAGLFLFQNLSGIDAILYYAPMIFKNAGFSGTTAALIATMGLGITNVLATILSMWLVDRLGRRILFLYGLALMVISLLIFSGSILFLSHTEFAGWVNITCLVSFIIFFAVSMGPLPYVLMSELFPVNIRTLGMSIAVSAAWGVNAVVTLLFLPALESIGLGWLFVIFAGICLAAFFIVLLFLPETRHCSLESIEKKLLNRKALRHIGQ